MNPPISRQPACGKCGHEEHIVFPCEVCPCGPHMPTGIYPEMPVLIIRQEPGRYS